SIASDGGLPIPLIPEHVAEADVSIHESWLDADGLSVGVDGLGQALAVFQLDSPSYAQRVAAQEALQGSGKDGVAGGQDALRNKRLGVHARMHAVWLLARTAGDDAVPALLTLAKADPEPRVQAQAIRAIGDLTDPVFRERRLKATSGSGKVARDLATVA